MSNAVPRLLLSILAIASLALTACGSKTPPKSTTTTRTQTETSNDSGDKATTESTQTTTEQSDGSQTVKKTETTNTTVPAPGK
jgi:predicted small lipoprotein YifL